MTAPGLLRGATRFLKSWWPRRTPEAEDAPRGGGEGRVLFVGPRYEPLTERMRHWLQELADWSRRSRAVEFLFEDDASTQRIRQAIAARPGVPLLLIFFGHGAPDALLTKPGQGFEPFGNDGRHDRLCVADHFRDDGPSHVFGFCCHSAQSFGQGLRTRREGNGFLGFRDAILFPVPLVGEREEAFKRPVQAALDPVIQSGRLDPDAPRRLYDEYAIEHQRWYDDPPRDDELAMLVCMCLESHMELLESFI